MAYVKRRMPAKNAETKVKLVFSDIKGIDLRSDDTGERRSPDSVNMYREKSGAWITHPGFRAVSSFEGRCHGIYRLGEKMLVHISSFIYLWENYPQPFEKENALLLYEGVKDAKVKTAVFSGRLIIADGIKLLVFDGESIYAAQEKAFVPQVWMSKKPDASLGEAYQQRNLLTPYFTEGFTADGSSLTYVLSVKDLDDKEVFAWSEAGGSKTVYTEGEHFTVQREEGTVTFSSPINEPLTPGIENVFIKAAKTNPDLDGAINSCREVIVYDGRLFLTASETHPGSIFWSGAGDAFYFGELMQSDRTGAHSSITALQLLPDGSLLAISKGGSGSVCVLKSADTGESRLSETYIAQGGSSTTGTMSPFSHTVFVDDNVFLSHGGLYALSRNLSVSLERSVEHRSTLVDAKLSGEDIKNACMEEHMGYLYILFPSGHVYIADSSQRTASVSPWKEYEWAYLENIGMYKGKEQSDEGSLGGEFSAAGFLCSLGENDLYFGGDGYICKFNFDLIASGAKNSEVYHFDGRAINEYVKTPFSWFSDMSRYKKTVSGRSALYLKADTHAGAKVAWRTDKSFFKEDQELLMSSSCFDFRDVDFEDMSFLTFDRQTFALKRLKVKRFMRLQLLIKSSGFKKHLAVMAVSIEAKLLSKKL